MTSPAPGWYPDPGGAAPYRWWNGQAWTTATSDGTTPATAQPVPAAPAAAAVPAYGAAQGYGAAATGYDPSAQVGHHAAQQQWAASPEAGAPQNPQQPQYGSSYSQVMSTQQARNSTFYHQNQYAVYTFIITAIYFVIAFSIGLVFIGVAPAFGAWRSKDRGEPMAPLAIGAAVVAVIFGIVMFRNNT
ncbi:MAG TPA: DUF2510 domain-containing protein [Mycobacteriales bacterium]|nr:DUF2510 domain-containing protein [Mycobacteriales bacterium]